MEDPIAEIPSIIHGLTTSSSVITQRTTLERYFLPDARFDHPLCRVDSFTCPLFSRSFILGVYRWYKLLSPNIELEVESVAFDEPNRRLYITVTQTFAFWFFPCSRVPATLVTVLELEKQRRAAGRVGDESPSEYSSDGLERDEKWYIKSQTDLYQFEQWIGLVPFVGLLARALVLFWKRIVGWSCLVFATVMLWLGLAVDRTKDAARARRNDSAVQFVTRIQRQAMGNVQRKRK